MAEPTVFTFNYKELVTLLLKEQNIHEGIWSIYFKFGIQGANAGPDDSTLLPSVIVPITEVGIQKTNKMTNLAVDAGEVNPRKAVKKPGK
ncbi:hypothetical protein [Candidatus Nitrospira nitrificans]|uniref:Uncharacterized protein n=1 Tax=Candidatus Nitrospira nitrificans TaxID=1742973 RepID=A0A0S4L6Z6_9BACT|nr:hypothetical protein [Candidatus Nitrospira nitrificans]CUS33505.1 conserved hypothetical protein [Candidatus Nitrospira nitrificans]